MLSAKTYLAITGIVIFLIGIAYGVHTASNLTKLPIEASDLPSRWLNYIEGFGVAVAIMAFGGLLIFLSHRNRSR